MVPDIKKSHERNLAANSFLGIAKPLQGTVTAVYVRGPSNRWLRFEGRLDVGDFQSITRSDGPAAATSAPERASNSSVFFTASAQRSAPAPFLWQHPYVRVDLEIRQPQRLCTLIADSVEGAAAADSVVSDICPTRSGDRGPLTPVGCGGRTDAPVRSQSAAELSQAFGNQQNQQPDLQVCRATNTA